jgi:hypothetical protein
MLKLNSQVLLNSQAKIKYELAPTSILESSVQPAAASGITSSILCELIWGITNPNI